MGKDTGFLEYRRDANHLKNELERIQNFDELYDRLPEARRREQGARCMNCGVPFCQSGMTLRGMVTGCPLHNLIPEWNDLIFRGDEKQALGRLMKTSSFPEFTGRVCPALCEKACVLGLVDESVTIHDNELYLIETGFKNGWVTPQVPALRSGKKIAVVGAGPSGLAAADLLNKRGHSVTVYERDEEIGGLLMYGIPNQKLPKDVVLRRKKLMEEEGVSFVCGTEVGKDITADELREKYDAVILTCGAKKARPLQAEGIEEAKGVHFAVDFLSSVTRSLMGGKKKCITAKGKHVVIVGGGDTGNDCVGTSIRQGALSVTQIEMMGEPPAERRPDNPWPQWPLVRKTDYGQCEAAAVFGSDPRIYNTTVRAVKTDKKGQIKACEIVKVKFENGKLSEVEGTRQWIDCDLLLIAAGFLGAEAGVPDAFQAALDQRSRVVTAPGSYRSAQASTDSCAVYAAGDMRRGQSLVVWAIAEGRAAAKEADIELMGYSTY